MRRIFNTEPLRSHVEAEVAPGPAVGSDAELLDFIRGFAQSMHHWVGTCRMGQDATAVVDSRLKVRGVDGLRIIDASVMPLLPSGNTNAPVLMIGEKGADLVRQDALS
jgi:choline dehydrogenase